MPAPDNQFRDVLRHFVLRARRVAAHSLAADPSALRKLATGAMTIQIRPDEGKAYILQSLPAEEQLESAAARVRPLLLESEVTHMAKALTATGYFVRDEPELSERVAAIRKDWRTLLDRKVAAGSYTQVLTADGSTAMLSDLQLANAYFYGDVVHHDTGRLTETLAFGLGPRFQAAALVIPRVMLQALALLAVVRTAGERGLVELPAEIWTAEVVVAETELRREADVHVAPVGTEPPANIGEPFGQEWERINPQAP